MKRGFTLVEVLIVVAIVSILISISVYGFFVYTVHAARVQVISDLRNCLGLIAIFRQTGEEKSLSDIISNCPKSPYTTSIVLESEDPIIIRAEAYTKLGNLSCTYDEDIGQVNCSSPF